VHSSPLAMHNDTGSAQASPSVNQSVAMVPVDRVTGK